MMIEKQPLTTDLVIRSLNTCYAIEVATLTQLPLGADINAAVYKAETPEGVSYFIKLKRGRHHDIAAAIVQLLQKQGIQQIIPPVKTIQGQSMQLLEEHTLIVYPFIAGQNGFQRHLTDKQWFDLGKTLRQVHELKVPAALQQQIRKETYAPQWREAVRALCRHIETAPGSDEAAVKLSQLMKYKLPVIRRLVDRAAQLSEAIQGRATDCVLCHADIHAGNVLLGENDTLYIVDWDAPIMAPKERDLMFIGGGVANVWNQPREEKLFYEGYGNNVINPAILAYYRHERIVEDIAEYGQELLLKASGGTDREGMFKEFKNMFAPGGVVDIAFQSDKSLPV